MAKTKIEWTDRTWNPVRGCTKISPGCANCYASTFAERWRGIPGHPYEQGFDLRLVPEKLHEPFHWKKPCRVFVNSMSDLFHEGVPEYFIDDVFRAMWKCPQHTFQVLTKRADRMADYCGKRWGTFDGRAWPPAPNVWLGVSVEDQRYADERIPYLLSTPATVRFLSCDPLLGPVNLEPWLNMLAKSGEGGWLPSGAMQWVIVGCESGHKRRPMQTEWAASIVDQCRAAGVAVFMRRMAVAGKVSGEIDDFPENLRVRDFPKQGGPIAGKDLRARSEVPTP